MSFHNVPPNGFPDLPDVEELEAVEKDVVTLKSTATSQGEAITALQTAVGTKAAKADVAPTFSAEGNYAVGDLVYYEGTLYKCTTAHEAAAWDAEDFTATSIDDEVNELNSNLTSKQDATDNNLTTTNKTIVGGINELKSGLADVTTLLQITQLSDTATEYQLQGNYTDYMFEH